MWRWTVPAFLECGQERFLAKNEKEVAVPKSLVAMLRSRDVVYPLRPGAPLFRRGRFDDRGNFRNLIRRESALLRMLTDHGFIGRTIDAVGLVSRNVGVSPRNLLN